MNLSFLAVSELDVVLFSLFILLCFVLLFAYAIYFYWVRKEDRCLSPYTQKPMRFGRDLPISSIEKVMRFLHYEIGGFDNRIFLMKRSMICRETGRIFQNAVTLTGRPIVNWDFIVKRHPGNYISWGSLSKELQEDIRASHKSLEGFQTEQSSPNPNPKNVTSEFVYIKPGPLYVDIKTKILVGWKIVPGTSFEVLVVQKPLYSYSKKDFMQKSRFKSKKPN